MAEKGGEKILRRREGEKPENSKGGGAYGKGGRENCREQKQGDKQLYIVEKEINHEEEESVWKVLRKKEL